MRWLLLAVVIAGCASSRAERKLYGDARMEPEQADLIESAQLKYGWSGAAKWNSIFAAIGSGVCFGLMAESASPDYTLCGVAGGIAAASLGTGLLLDHSARADIDAAAFRQGIFYERQWPDGDASINQLLCRELPQGTEVPASWNGQKPSWTASRYDCIVNEKGSGLVHYFCAELSTGVGCTKPGGG